MAASTTPSVVVLAGPIRAGDAPLLCDQVRAALRGAPAGADARTVVCDVSAVTSTDLATLDALARMQLAARRAGGRIRLRDPSPRLTLMLGLTGLDGVLAPEGASDPGSGVQVLRDAEQREPPLAEVQEAVETGDPAV
ncbi:MULTISPECIES: STAS domain-containing protein [Streptomyces]|uniref:STAS domain-containing protein n=1 Tax=Streptomyces TaxID=1883 RepID=UPI001CB7AC71|nr:STAS domain-containing protein [Streptomyces xanthii]